MIQSPFCQLCLRQFARAPASSPIRQQLRGKKKLAKKAKVINVRLLQDVPLYGRQGTIVPVAPELMRCAWFPQMTAEYVTKDQLRQLNLRNATFERDATFGIPQPVREKPEEVEEKASSLADLKLTLISPQEATQLLSEHLPSELVFYRVPIPQKPRPVRRIGNAVTSAAAELAAANEPDPDPEPVAIYGSVSTLDVVARIKELLAEVPRASKVVLTPDEVTFEGETGVQTEPQDWELDRVKFLGRFDVKFEIKGADEPVRRTIVVEAGDGSSDESDQRNPPELQQHATETRIT